MALNAQLVSFDVSSGGQLIVPLNAGIDAKICFLWTHGQQGNTTIQQPMRCNFGIATLNGQCGSSWQYADTASNSIAYRYLNNVDILDIYLGSGARQDRINLTNFGPGNDQLNLNVINNSRTYRCHALVLGGSDIINTGWHQQQVPATPGTWDITSQTFQPNFCVWLNHFAGNIGHNASIGECIGFVTEQAQLSRYIVALHNQATSSCHTMCASVASVQPDPGTPGNYYHRMLFDSFLPNGIRWNNDVVNWGGEAIGFFAEFAEPPVVGTQQSPLAPAIKVNNPGHTPKGTFYFSSRRAFNEQWPLDDLENCMGGSDGLTNGMFSVMSRNNVSSVTNHNTDDDTMVVAHFEAAGTAPAVAERAQSSYNGNTIEDDWIDADSNFANEYGWVSFGESSGVPTINPSATGTFSGDSSGDVIATHFPSGTGTFSAASSGEVVKQAPTLNPSGTGTFSAASSGDVAKLALINPSATGTFSAASSGDVIKQSPTLNPSATGTFSAASSGDIIKQSPTLNPSATGTFSAAASGDVAKIHQPSATGTFSADSSGRVDTQIPTINPSATGTFSAAASGDVAKIHQPSATGTFSAASSGSVNKIGIINPSATGTFSAAATGSINKLGVINPSATGAFSAASSGDVRIKVNPSGTGSFSAASSGSVNKIGIINPSATGAFTADSLGDVTVLPLLRPSATGRFTGLATGFVQSEAFQPPQGLRIFEVPVRRTIDDVPIRRTIFEP